MQAFHSDIKIKEKYVNRVIAHQEADNLIRGTGWENGKGCAIGCTLENYDHSQYPIELGIPEWLARVEDALFEGMSLEKSKTWPEVFLKSIPVGFSDWDKVKSKFMICVLESALTSFDHDKFPDVKSVIDGSIKLWQRDDIGSMEFIGAAARATDAAEAAWAAAWAAAGAAAGAAEAAWAAAWAAAGAAARAAANAAEAAGAARSEKYDYFSDQLILIFKELGNDKN